MSDPSLITLVIPEALDGQRLDRALAVIAADEGLALSRSRLATLIGEGAVKGPNGTVSRAQKATLGEVYSVRVPRPTAPKPQAEAITLNVVHEDNHLVVVNKPAGMVVHPAPGAETGTLVNALLHHCGETLAGIGGERRPGIVHRIDKDTSGLLVAAKTEIAHAGLSKLFADHIIDREYTALAWSAPSRNDPRLAATDGVTFPGPNRLRIETEIARHPQERKRMAVVSSGGRRAVTFATLTECFGPAEAPFASRLTCRLETGRTHQIRVHLSHIGHSLLGDPVYGRARQISSRAASDAARRAVAAFSRQALHAALLGFEHPISGEKMVFRAELPQDMNELLSCLRRNI